MVNNLLASLCGEEFGCGRAGIGVYPIYFHIA